MSHTSNGRTKWEETPRGATRASTTNITRSGDIPLRTVELYGIIWSSLLEREDYNNFCTGPTSRGTNQGQGLK